MRSPWQRFSAFVEENETRDWGPETVFLVLAGIIAVRNLLEIAVARNPVFESLAAFVHYPLAYLGPFLALTLVLSFWSRVSPVRVSRLMVQAWLLTLLPPLADWFLHRGSENPTIAYLHADPMELPWIVANFFNPFASFTGTTGGIRIEAFAAVLAGALYVFLRSGRWWRAVGAAISIYLVSLFFFCLPVLVLFSFRFLQPRFDWPDLLRGEAFLLRPEPASSPDSMGIFWLIPVLLVLGLGWRWWERRFPERWLTDLPACALPGLPLYLAGTLLLGTWYAMRLRFPPGLPIVAVPFDYLAPVGAALAVLLLSSGVLRCSGRSRAWIWLLPGLALAAGLGRSVSVGLLASAGVLLPLGLLLFEHRLRRAVMDVALPLSALGAFCAGFALLVGPEALARLPVSIVFLPMTCALALAVFAWGESPRKTWLLPAGLALFAAAGAWFAMGTSVALAAGLGGAVAGGFGAFADRNQSRRASAVWTCILSSALLFIAGSVHLGNEDSMQMLSEEMRCVARLNFLRGDQNERNGEEAFAASSYESALACDSNYVPALEALGNLLLDKPKALRLGVRRLEKAVSLAPDNAGLRNNLAAAYIKDSQLERALEELDAARTLDRRQPTVLANRARVLESLGQYDEALAEWESYVELAWARPSQAETLVEAARSIRRLKRRKL